LWLELRGTIGRQTSEEPPQESGFVLQACCQALLREQPHQGNFAGCDLETLCHTRRIAPSAEVKRIVEAQREAERKQQETASVSCESSLSN